MTIIDDTTPMDVDVDTPFFDTPFFDNVGPQLLNEERYILIYFILQGRQGYPCCEALRNHNTSLSEINFALNAELCRMKEAQKMVEVQLDKASKDGRLVH